jgi:hypothetical protein
MFLLETGTLHLARYLDLSEAFSEEEAFTLKFLTALRDVQNAICRPARRRLRP